MRTATLASGIAVGYADDLDGALGTSTRGRIHVLNGPAPAEELMVLAHEWAHKLLHRNGERAGRDTRELEAEAVAFVVGETVGLDAGQAM